VVRSSLPVDDVEEGLGRSGCRDSETGRVEWKLLSCDKFG
jgi:hypothetical protein